MQGLPVWLLGQSVSLLTASVTSLGLPFFATWLQSITCFDANDADLLIVGKLIATVVLPSLVTALCHAECFGAW
eukprot:42291-Amphidinium_carterae.1